MPAKIHQDCPVFGEGACCTEEFLGTARQTVEDHHRHAGPAGIEVVDLNAATYIQEMLLSDVVGFGHEVSSLSGRSLPTRDG